MKKIVRQQNYLKELIESQDNHLISRIGLVALVRAVLEPLLDNPESGVVLHRINNRNGLLGLLKRLDFSEIESFDYIDESKNLKEKVWANTEFICVMTHRFVSIILWDNNTNNKGYYRYYSIVNSKLQNEALDIIGRNSKINIKEFQEKYTPDRRDNLLLNSSVRRLIENLEEASTDAVLGFAESQTKQTEYGEDTRIVAHELRNQLSICDLYNEVIKKYCTKNSIEAKTINNALNNISKAIKISNNLLVSLKSNHTEIKPYNLKELVETACDLARVYFEGKNIKFEVENKENINILVDENRFIQVVVNILKNGIEAFEKEGKSVRRTGKCIKVKTERSNEFAVIRISNNGAKINEPEKIFEKGYTTKQTGSGLGLSICRKTIEEFLGQLELSQTGKDCTEFVIKLGVV